MGRVDSALWRDMVAHLRDHHPSVCRQWFSELEPLELDGGVLSIAANGGIQRKYLDHKCREAFTEAAQDVTGNLVMIEFLEKGEKPRSPSGRSTPGSNGRLDTVVISPDYSFDNFISGPNNRLAHAAAVAVANNPGQAYNPLFIHGGVGLGKTHLLQAISQQIMDHHPDFEILYLSCDSFVNQFLDCVQSGQMSDFRNRYRDVDLLVIDDIHFLTGKEQTQEEFFHTFNALYQSKRQIVLSSDSPPSEIPQLEERLVSRFQWGLIAHVSRPTFETRMAILRSKAQMRELDLDDEVIALIAKRIDSNARELEGAITTLQGHAALQNRPLDIHLAREILGDAGFDAPSGQDALQQIIDTVTDYYGVKLSDLQSRRRHKSVTEPRQVCMWLVRKHTRFSLEEIGGYFGGRDHTTVMHSIKTVDQRSETDQEFGRGLETLEGRLTHLAE